MNCTKNIIGRGHQLIFNILSLGQKLVKNKPTKY